MITPMAYGVSKGGLIHSTKLLSVKLAPKIRVNAISPGGVFRNQSKKFLKKYLSKTPLKRMANENEISNVVIFLSSDLSSYITGHNLIIDGGYSLT
jgi:NAD(P)-dependent dehydrogenase (short-subunit alcohol dehydrogenase family)|tara:strand:- start:1338 stop:1625 length:288 start_codon:yes stop_codon:yes gene_type:complete